MTALDHAVRRTTGWATARGHRRVPADAAAARTSAGRFAIAVADGVGDTAEAALAAQLAVTAAVDEAWAADTAGAPPAVRHALSGDAPTIPVGRSPDDGTPAIPTRRSHDGPAPPPRDIEPGDGTGDLHTGDTTFAVAAGDAEHGWTVTWVGDCRAYFVPDTAAAPVLLTADHTLGQYLRDRDVRAHPGMDHVVTTTARKGVPGFATGPAGAGRLVLLTNGVHHHLDAAAIARVAREVADPATAARVLVDAAIAAGGSDNAAATVADVR
ncbi:PP2C family protein-serine/threonine phosphatase [Saccharothrix obliqua]|uniref:PP2C family protein-serine/threonine phosphatase n=1 Tax=Saccharothrix obliqua TaxID=2861747 RepID=UPI001C5FD5D3|nr:hypothetical protein [Saccharothrix obliqua]MBW4718381.1 hypothetical protein [Saccharothrix obliqua]